MGWRLPADATDDLRSRVHIDKRDGGGGGGPHVSELRLVRLGYADTGTFVCTYDGTGPDTSSPDNSTRVHLYVEDGRHLMVSSGVEMLQFVQSARAVLPCRPTSPQVNVTLHKEGEDEPVVMGKGGVTFDPRVRRFFWMQNSMLYD